MSVRVGDWVTGSGPRLRGSDTLEVAQTIETRRGPYSKFPEVGLVRNVLGILKGTVRDLSFKGLYGPLKTDV